MSTNAAFVKRLRAAKTQWARFCLCDFHVHSPASYDVRKPGLYKHLSASEQDMLKNIAIPNSSTDLVVHEKAVLNAYPPVEYYKNLVARRNEIATQLGLSEAEDWAFIAITDHNVCEYSTKVAEIAWNEKSKNRLIAMPAIELDITFVVDGTKDSASIHLLVIFSPSTTDADIRVAIHNASGIDWKPGNTSLAIQSLPNFVQGLRNHTKYPAICIAAHVSSSKGVQSETAKLLLSYVDAEIVALESSKLSDHADKQEIQKQIDHIKDNNVSLGVLKIIGECGFDALQVSNVTDEKHYRRLHRFRSEHGRSTPIVCSDAHASSKVFNAGGGAVPHLKVCRTPDTQAEWLSEIRKAIRCGETRFTHIAPGNVSKWIEGIEVIPDADGAAKFWPTPSNSFNLPFSRNLNCIIGGRGSGKSAVIEAIGFLTKPEDYQLTPAQREETDYYKRAKATLQGCKIKLCWKSNTKDGESSIPTGGLYISRYFDPKDSHKKTEITSKDDISIPSPTIPSVQLYRFKEIESKADADGLRELLDDICGHEVGELSIKIDQCVKALLDQSSAVIERARVITSLTKDGAPLRKYAALLLEYHQANKAEVQSHYEALDKIEIAGKAAITFVNEWQTLRNTLGLDGAKASIERFFEDLTNKCYDDNGKLVPYFNELAVLLETDTVNPDLKKEILEALSKIEGYISGTQNILSTSHQALQAKYQSEKDALVSKGLPVGSKDREAKKSALDDAKSALTKYRSALTEYGETCIEREVLFGELQKHCKRRTELREQTAKKITDQLARDLEDTNLVIMAQAQPMADQKEFGKWLEKYIAPHIPRHRPARIKALLEKKSLMPSDLRALLHGDGKVQSDILSTGEARASDGLLTTVEADEIVKATKARERLDPEVRQGDVDEAVWNDLPSEIKEGLWTFYDDVAGQHKLKLHHVLELDQIVFDDIPVILLNDRPLDVGSKPRPLNQLSPGQRCSAILPILLLNGDSPLIIDQPEDNLDNSLIRQVIVNVLASIKLRRQVIVATHNPNLPVLGDAEQTIALKAIDENKSEMEAHGNLDQSEIVGRITDIMEGGREAFQYRQTIYQQHWIGHVES